MPSAIDVHVHVPVEAGGPAARVEELVVMYKKLDMFGHILGRDSQTATGSVDTDNDYIAAIVKKYPRSFIGICSVDPHMGKVAVFQAERAVKELGMKGLKFEPYRQEFYLNDPRFYPLWEKIQDLGVPIMTHTGMIQGTSRQRLDYCRPVPYLDNLAADFPGLTIIACHPSFPWQDEMLAVAAHKENVYVELSAGWPKFFSENLVRYINTFLQDKVMFGSGYPLFGPEEWVKQFGALAMEPEVRKKVLRENAARLFGKVGK